MPAKYIPTDAKRACQHCGAEFTITNSSKANRFCSQACWAAFRIREVERTCEHCGKIFIARPGRVARGVGRFCSRTCNTLHAIRPFEERFWEKVDKDGPIPPHRPEFGQCWVWIASTGTHGYGQFNPGIHSARPLRAHRVAFEMAYGPMPDGTMVGHICDNPACVRNDSEGWYEVNGVLRPRRGHLFLGTKADNMIDKLAKGRANMPFGEQRPDAKLTWGSVRAIRARFAVGGVTKKALADEYGVSPETIRNIINGEKWKERP